MPASQPYRITVSFSRQHREKVNELAGKMRMRPATYVGWLMANILENLEAAETVAEALSKVAHTIPPDDLRPMRSEGKKRTTGKPRARARATR